MFYVVYLLTASQSGSSNICVKPAPLSHQRRSTFYRRSHSTSSSLSSSSATAAVGRFHCDVSVMCDTADDGHFMFNFTTDTASGRTDAHETDKTNDTDKDTLTVTNKLTGNITDTGNTTSGTDKRTQCDKDKDVTAVQENFTSLNSVLCFNTSAHTTPFLFNFDSNLQEL